MECVRDQELEWMTSKGTEMSALRGPLLLPLGCVRWLQVGWERDSRVQGYAATKGKIGEGLKSLEL